jgi:hypothetical protein
MRGSLLVLLVVVALLSGAPQKAKITAAELKKLPLARYKMWETIRTSYQYPYSGFNDSLEDLTSTIWPAGNSDKVFFLSGYFVTCWKREQGKLVRKWQIGTKEVLAQQNPKVRGPLLKYLALNGWAPAKRLKGEPKKDLERDWPLAMYLFVPVDHSLRRGLIRTNGVYEREGYEAPDNFSSVGLLMTEPERQFLLGKR